MDLAPFILTFKLALITTFILLVISIPIAYWLAYTKSKAKFLFETIITLPMVLPPSVLGFYLLVSFGQNSALGRFLHQHFDIYLPFSFTGLVVGSLIYSLPFMVNPIHAGFQNLGESLRDASWTLGKSRWTTLVRVLLPNIKPSVFTGIVLSFAHTVGEFGVVLMIGGNLDSTRVASIAIYDNVNKMDYIGAHQYALVLVAVSFVMLASVYLLNRRGVRYL
ncbi:MAG: molybdate transport system permease protein [Cryomorphaceae bacterium]|jgi:molybdate transport system permease protein